MSAWRKRVTARVTPGMHPDYIESRQALAALQAEADQPKPPAVIRATSLAEAERTRYAGLDAPAFVRENCLTGMCRATLQASSPMPVR